MHNIIVELFDGEVIVMNRVLLKDALEQLWRSYGEHIMSMSVEPSGRPARLQKRYNAFGNVVRA